MAVQVKGGAAAAAAEAGAGAAKLHSNFTLMHPRTHPRIQALTHPGDVVGQVAKGRDDVEIEGQLWFGHGAGGCLYTTSINVYEDGKIQYSMSAVFSVVTSLTSQHPAKPRCSD